MSSVSILPDSVSSIRNSLRSSVRSIVGATTRGSVRSSARSSAVGSIRDGANPSYYGYGFDNDEEDDDEEGEEREEKEFKPSEIDLSKYDNVPLEDIHLDVRPRIKNIIEELYTEHDWVWPPAPPKDVRKLRFFKRKKNKLLYNKEVLDFATFLSIIIGPIELYVAIIFTTLPKTFILAMRECVEITVLIILIFFVQGLYHIYAGVLGLALRASRPFEIGYVYPHWRFQVACPLLAMFCVFAGMYMTQDWMIEKEMLTHLKGYNFHWYSKHMWDNYQSFMRCCGVHSYLDWKYHGPIMYDEKNERTLGVPESCCYTTNCSFEPNEENVYSGCFEKTVWAFWTLYVLGAICVAVSFILLCVGHKSIQESSRYSGDPIHKLLFDDRWSRKRLHNRSNRREELFSLLNHYCLILGKELGFDDEVEKAKKEEAERQKEDEELDDQTGLYENLDTYAGNSPPTPNSVTDLVDDLHLPPGSIKDPPQKAPMEQKEKEQEKEKREEEKKEQQKEDEILRESILEWKPSVSAPNDEFPLRTEKSFRNQDYTVLPSIIKMNANIKANLLFKSMEDDSRLKQELEHAEKLVTEIPKISKLVQPRTIIKDTSTVIAKTHVNIEKTGAKESTTVVKNNPDSTSFSPSVSTGGGTETPLTVRFLDKNSERNIEQKPCLGKNVEEPQVVEPARETVPKISPDLSSKVDSQIVSIVSLGHMSPERLYSMQNIEADPDPAMALAVTDNFLATNESLEESVQNYQAALLDDAAMAPLTVMPEMSGGLPDDDKVSTEIYSESNKEELPVNDLEPLRKIPPRDSLQEESNILVMANFAELAAENVGPDPEPIHTPRELVSISTPQKQEQSPHESILQMAVDCLLPEEKAQTANKNVDLREPSKLSRIPTHSKTAPAYFKSALEQAQGKLARKDQSENLSNLENALNTAMRTNADVQPEKPAAAAEAFKELVAVLNKSSSLTKLNPAENKAKDLELKKSHEFDGFTPTSVLRGQKGKRSGIPTVSTPGTKSPKQNISLISKINFPKRVGETVLSDSDQEGRTSPRAERGSRLPKRSKPMNR